MSPPLCNLMAEGYMLIHCALSHVPTSCWSAQHSCLHAHKQVGLYLVEVLVCCRLGRRRLGWCRLGGNARALLGGLRGGAQGPRSERRGI